MMAVEAGGLTKSFGGRRQALDKVGLELARGEMVALIGASGLGKSTLIRSLSSLSCCDAGEVSVFGERVQEGGRLTRRAGAQRRHVGIIFQQFNLVSRLTVLTNVLVGLIGRSPPGVRISAQFTGRETAAMACLHRVGLAEHAPQRACTLSGGQQQRVAIARVLVQQAHLILADEPIACLDPQAARRVMEILTRINREDGATCLVSLHQVDYAIAYCPRTIALRDGASSTTATAGR